MPEFGEYRPAYLTLFKLQYEVFGLHAFGYHLTNVLLHLGTAALLWVLVLRLTGRLAVAHVAAFVLAVHPAYRDAVNWITNGNAVLATFLCVLSFLLFTLYAESGRPGRWYAAFLVVFVAALLTHQLALTLAPVLALWWAGKQGSRLLEARTWAPLVAPVALTGAMFLLHLWVRADHGAASAGLQWGPHVRDNFRDYLGLSLYPIKSDASAMSYVALLTAGLGLLAIALNRNIVSVAAVAWYVLSVLPNSTWILGAYPRTLYSAGPALALVLALVAVRLLDGVSALTERRGAKLRVAPALIVLAGAVAFVPVALGLEKAHDEVAAEFSIPPERDIGSETAANMRFIDQLRSQVPSLPAGAKLYVAKPPFNLVLFDDSALTNLVRLYYGDVDVRSLPMREHPFWDEATARRLLRPGDVVFVYER